MIVLAGKLSPQFSSNQRSLNFFLSQECSGRWKECLLSSATSPILYPLHCHPSPYATLCRKVTHSAINQF